MSLNQNLDQILEIEKHDELFVKATGTYEVSLFSPDMRGPLIGQDLVNRGMYWNNNGVVCYVDKEGDIYVGRATAEAFDALREAGYEASNIFVWHSNDMGCWIKENFDKPRQEKAQRLQEEAKKKELMEELNRRISKLKPVDGLEAMVATGTHEYSFFSPEHEGQLNGRYPDEAGLYSTNNSTLAYVGSDGIVYATWNTSKAREAVEAAGYERGYFWVPHSNDMGIVLRKYLGEPKRD